MTGRICICCVKPEGEHTNFRGKLTNAMWAKVNLYRHQKELGNIYGSWVYCETCLQAIVTDDTEYLNAVELKRKLLA